MALSVNVVRSSIAQTTINNNKANNVSFAGNKSSVAKKDKVNPLKIGLTLTAIAATIIAGFALLKHSVEKKQNGKVKELINDAFNNLKKDINKLKHNAADEAEIKEGAIKLDLNNKAKIKEKIQKCLMDEIKALQNMEKNYSTDSFDMYNAGNFPIS